MSIKMFRPAAAIMMAVSLAAFADAQEAAATDQSAEKTDAASQRQDVLPTLEKILKSKKPKMYKGIVVSRTKNNSVTVTPDHITRQGGELCLAYQVEEQNADEGLFSFWTYCRPNSKGKKSAKNQSQVDLTFYFNSMAESKPQPTRNDVNSSGKIDLTAYFRTLGFKSQ